MKFLLSLIVLSVTYNLSAQTILTKDFKFQNRNREYIVFLPTGFTLNQKLPVYIALHGNIGTDKGIMNYTGINNIADTAKFIAVYPQGISKSWADGRGTTDADQMHADDVGFISTLIDTIVTNYRADANRVYAAGISNGGFMVQRLLCDLPEKIAAGASIAAEIMDSLHTFCNIKYAKPVMLFHGTKDKHVPYYGGALNGKNGGNGKDGYSFSADSSFYLWAKRDSCKGSYTEEHLPDKIKTDNCTVIKKNYTDCKGETNVILYTIVDGGHSWPGGRSTRATQFLLGNTNEDINAGIETWKKFANR